MALNELIRELRERAGFKKTDFAKKLGVTATHTTTIERPYKKGSTLPSEELLEKIASLVARNEEEKKELEIKLLLERVRAAVSPKIRRYIHDFPTPEHMETIPSSDAMPKQFRERLREDIRALKIGKEDEVYRQSGLSKQIVKDAIEGKYLLSKRQVTLLALALRQSPEEYLLLADYIPDLVKEILDEELINTLADAKSLKIPGSVMKDALKRISDLIIQCKKKN